LARECDDAYELREPRSAYGLGFALQNDALRSENQLKEYVAEDGTVYRLTDWTDDEFNKAGMMSACKDDDTVAEEIFDV